MTAAGNPNRPATLANGATVPLAEAARWLALLESYADDPGLEWEMLHLLRAACLGRRLEPEQLRALVSERLLESGGAVDPTLNAVVLSAVRGEGRVLHLESPFTEPLDRAMADYIRSREYVRAHLDPAAAEAFLAQDPVQDSFERYRDATHPGTNWRAREADRRAPPPDDTPPHSH